MILILILALIIIGIGRIAWRKEDMDIDSQYLDGDGDHIYYDRSVIEKKIFRKMFPDITDLRSLKQFFK